MESNNPEAIEARLMQDYGDDQHVGELAVHFLWNLIRQGTDIETAVHRVHTEFSELQE